MRQGWEIKRLEEVCKIGDGNHSSKYPKSNEMMSEGVPFIRANNLSDGQVTWEEMKFITAAKHLTLKKGHLKAGDILFTNRGDIGKVAIVGPDFDNSNLNSQIAWFRCNDNLNNRFLFHILTSPFMQKHYLLQKNGAALQQFTIGQINKLLIPLPHLHEQVSIVAILDEAFDAIARAKANAEQNLKNVRELFESYLQSMFENKGEGWEERTLEEIAYVKSGGTPSRSKKEYWEGNIAWYSSGELNNLFTANPERHINNLAIDNSNAKLFPKGSLLIGMYDTAALKMSILDRDGTFNQAIAGVKPNEKIDLIFVLHAINSIKPELLSLRRGVRQKNLSLEKIKNIKISLPSLNEQQAIIQKLDLLSTETKKLEAIYQQKIAVLDELKKSLLQKAFSGELVSEHDFVD